MMLFDVLEKPMIFADNGNNFRKFSSMMSAFGNKQSAVEMRVKMQKAFEFYQVLEKKNVRDPIDEKLFRMIDKRFNTYNKFSNSKRRTKI